VVRCSATAEIRIRDELCLTNCFGSLPISFIYFQFQLCLLAHAGHAFVAAPEGEDSGEDEGVAGAGP
jgi:hypothetical protein